MQQQMMQASHLQTAKDNFCKSRKSDEIFAVVKSGRDGGCLSLLIEL